MTKAIAVMTRLSTKHTAEDGAVERHETQSGGKGWFHDDQWVVRFAEREEGRDKVMTTIKATQDRLTVIRHGDVTMRHVFDPAKETRGLYGHPYGSMEMVTKTESLHRRELRDGWQVEWFYGLTLNGVAAGTFHMNLTIKPVRMECE